MLEEVTGATVGGTRVGMGGGAYEDVCEGVQDRAAKT